MNFFKDNVAIKDFITISKKIYMDVSFVLRFKVKI